MPRVKAVMVTALAALFAPALFALDIQNPPPASIAGPGTLNYIEGTATLDGQPVGQANRYASLKAGQVLATTNGRAELLLTPGVFLRLGHDSAVKMVSPDLTNTVLALEHGRATVEADQLFQDNDIHILEDKVPVQIVKTGLYEFDAENNTVMVFSGKAAALKPNEKFVTIKEHHELNLAAMPTARPHKFDEKKQEQAGLYRWSSLRSDYLAEGNQQLARQYGPGYSAGWYWDPAMWDYTFLGPYAFMSPFGWGFYPFGYMGMGMGWGGWGYPGYYGGGYYGGRGYGHAPGPHGPVDLPRGGFGGSEHPSGSSMGGHAFSGGGSMGGFHGGGGFGGFHGGGGGHGR